MADADEPVKPVRYLTKEDVLAIDDTKYEDVDCPEWGGTLTVRSLNGKQRATWQQESIVSRGNVQTINFQRSTLRLVTLGVVDQNRKQMFTEADLTALARKNSAPLERLADRIMKLSGIGEEEFAAFEGNSAASTNDD